MTGGGCDPVNSGNARTREEPEFSKEIRTTSLPISGDSI